MQRLYRTILVSVFLLSGVTFVDQIAVATEVQDSTVQIKMDHGAVDVSHETVSVQDSIHHDTDTGHHE